MYLGLVCQNSRNEGLVWGPKAQSCLGGASYRQIGFIHGHTGERLSRPPGTRSHGGWGTLHATITTYDARTRTERAEGGGMARPGS